MKPLHPNQEELLRILKENQSEDLTLRDLQEKVGLKSHNLVLHHLRQLEKRGLLRRNPSDPSDYQVLEENPESNVNYINLYGMAECGPNGMILEASPIDKIPISSRMFGFPAIEAFMVKARGKSMEPMIKHGDLVVARINNNPDDGDVIVCSYEGSALIKIFRSQAGKVFLESLNKSSNEFRPIPIDHPEEFQVAGIVKGVYSPV